ncbi:MAG: N-acetylmuramidase family protein [Muribaculaceae bacterium]|nr:N-acetylmuramidase family protein [Muribaculaceae bacterium]
MTRQRILTALLLAMMAAVAFCLGSEHDVSPVDRDTCVAVTDTVDVDTVALVQRYERLTDADYEAVASCLGVEVAAIKAVVLIEAGPGLKGFYEPGVPIINFDLAMFRKFAGRRNVKLSSYRKSHAVVFSSPDVSHYGSRQAAQHARLSAAMEIDSLSAIEGTFWGMFQIGGFNWRNCGCGSIGEFVQRMSLSEREQLDLFAAFITKCGMVKYLKSRNWAAFALRYNGPSYKQRGYDAKMAAAYRRFSAGNVGSGAG